ncbi:DUF3135 domain-containing protein [Granulosicoccus sp. 3-233]|uniref:DUF3135 domain-containing protein n=1 Tax=Granulosicoccus sp. 3-233 TaxID=3417969 RepID=UPI003D334E09
MQQNSTDDFDFDDWAGLYVENPEEFEARRQATLMIELMRQTPENARNGRQTLDSFELAVQNRNPEERLKMAASLMMDSVHQLSAELQLLKQALQQLEETASTEPL